MLAWWAVPCRSPCRSIVPQQVHKVRYGRSLPHGMAPESDTVSNVPHRNVPRSVPFFSVPEYGTELGLWTHASFQVHRVQRHLLRDLWRRYAAIHPEFLFPAPIIVYGGVFKGTVTPDFVTRLGVVIVFGSLGGMGGSILAMVIFRYTCNPHLDYCLRNYTRFVSVFRSGTSRF